MSTGQFFDEVLREASRARREGRAQDALRMLRREGEHTSLARETLRAALEMDAGAYASAEARYRRVIARAEETHDRRSWVFAHTGLAAVLRRAGRADEAYDVVKTVRRVAPASPEVATVQVAVLRDFIRSQQAAELSERCDELIEEFGLEQ